MDVLTPEQRHYNMSCIHSKDTKPELIVRKWLWRQGYRYRLQRKNLPGKPDIVLPKYHAVIFVNGCFWHRHNCKYSTIPQTRSNFWYKKLNDNVQRDKKNIKELTSLGWKVLVIWECEIKRWDSDLEKRINDFFHPEVHLYKNKDHYDDICEKIYIVAEDDPYYAE
jgi:DNA mismatch endonuclease (patch repair protein)